MIYHQILWNPLRPKRLSLESQHFGIQFILNEESFKNIYINPYFFLQCLNFLLGKASKKPSESVGGGTEGGDHTF